MAMPFFVMGIINDSETDCIEKLIYANSANH
jgi:hypothetical protein